MKIKPIFILNLVFVICAFYLSACKFQRNSRLTGAKEEVFLTGGQTDASATELIPRPSFKPAASGTPQPSASTTASPKPSTTVSPRPSATTTATATPAPAEVFPASFKNSMSMNANCLNQPDYDACLFWKNPVAQKGSLFSSTDITNIGTYQQLGIKLNTTSSNFETNSFKIILQTNPRSSVTNYSINLTNSPGPQRWRVNLTTDIQNKTFYMPQIASYFYLSEQEKFMKKYAGGFYIDTDATTTSTTGKNQFNNNHNKIFINALRIYDDNGRADESLINNAYYASDTDEIIAGTSNDSNFLPMAINGETMTHEMGHANLFHANRISENSINQTQQKSKFLLCSLNLITRTCKKDSTGAITVYLVNNNQINESTYPSSQWAIFSTGLSTTAMGNYDAINEGQADFHANILFRERPGVLETALKIIDPNNWDIRHPANPSQLNWTAKQFYENSPSVLMPLLKKLGALSFATSIKFNDSRSSVDAFSGKGECHDMGALYSTLLWEVYNHPQVKKMDFLKLFSEHLKLLTLSDDFKSSLQIFLSLDRTFYQGKYANIIKGVFAKRGISIN